MEDLWGADTDYNGWIVFRVGDPSHDGVAPRLAPVYDVHGPPSPRRAMIRCWITDA
jgi:hypothetical protein